MTTGREDRKRGWEDAEENKNEENYNGNKRRS